jgi:hypothetical protein
MSAAALSDGLLHLLSLANHWSGAFTIGSNALGSNELAKLVIDSLTERDRSASRALAPGIRLEEFHVVFQWLIGAPQNCAGVRRMCHKDQAARSSSSAV